jgi:hypothetical protein
MICKCSHSKDRHIRRHIEGSDACDALGCGCLYFREDIVEEELPAS